MTILCAWALCCAATLAPSLEFALRTQESAGDSSARVGQSKSGPGAPAAPSPEAEVLANLKQQAIGSATVADLDMPDEYLRRVAGRILRASFEEHFRIVVPDEKSPSDKSSPDPSHVKPADGAPDPGRGSAADPKSRTVDASRPLPASGEHAGSPASAENSWSSSSWLIGAGIGVCGLVIAAAARRAKRRGARAR